MIMQIKLTTINKNEKVYFEEPKVLYDDVEVVEVPKQALPHNEVDRVCIPGSTFYNNLDDEKYTSFCAAYWAARCKNKEDRKIFSDLSPSQIKEFVDDRIDSGMFTNLSDSDKQELFSSLYYNFLICGGIYSSDHPDKEGDVFSPGTTLIHTYPYKLKMTDTESNSIDLPIDVQLGLIMEARWELLRNDYLLYMDGYEKFVNRISNKDVRDEVIKFFTQHPKIGKPIDEAPEEIKKLCNSGGFNITMIQPSYKFGDHEINLGYPMDISVDQFKVSDEFWEDSKFMEEFYKITKEFDDTINSIDFDLNNIDYDDIFEKVKSKTNERLAVRYVDGLRLRVNGNKYYFDEETNTWKER